MLSFMSLLAINMYTFVVASTGLIDFFWIFLGFGGDSICPQCGIYN